MGEQSISGIFKNPDFGNLLLRAGIGGMMIAHGVPKFLGGSEMFRQVGSAMSIIGINYSPVTFGFLAAMVEVLGGFLLILGLWTRIVSFLLLFVMVMACLVLLKSNESFGLLSHPIELAVVFAGFIFIGAGKYSVDKE